MISHPSFSSHTHIWYELFLVKKRRYHVWNQTISCSWYTLLSTRRHYHYIFNATIVIRMCDFGFADPFLLFFWSIVFHGDLSFWILPSNSNSHRLGILPESDFPIPHCGTKRICEAVFSFFIRHVFRTLVICFDSAFRHVFVQLLLCMFRHFAR